MTLADGAPLMGTPLTARRAISSARALFLESGAAPRRLLRPVVLEAWQRSLAAGVNPERREVPVLLDPQTVSTRSAESELCHVAEPVLHTTHELLQETGHGVILADAQGMVLKVAGDPHLAAAAERIGCLPGATWHEAAAGNNAIGTALALRLPVQFLYAEHLCAGWVDWTCAAAPIRDQELDRTVGALCICAYGQGSQQALPMAARLAHLVGTRLGAAQRERVTLLAAEARRLLHWLHGSGAVALDRGGAPVWREGQVDERLWRALQVRTPGLLPAGRQAESELTVAGRFRCQAIPVWAGANWIGHVLLTGPVAAPAPRREPPVEAAPHPPRLVVRMQQRLAVVGLEQVYLLRARGPQVYALTGQGEFPVDSPSLQELAARLAPHDFFRTDRTYLVNLAKVRAILPMFNRTLRLQLSDPQHTEVPVSRRRSRALRLHLSLPEA